MIFFFFEAVHSIRLHKGGFRQCLQLSPTQFENEIDKYKT